ncbi:MAG: hypothetical protein J0M19_08630 [Sphingomonadales bacterium]|nr:hypothetical protein [Sphingomonadales bacterium]
MIEREAARAALAAASDRHALLKAASQALTLGLAAQVEPVLQSASERYPDEPRIWQFLGLARRNLQDSAGAHFAFSRAAALAPGDAIIAHSRARTALEAGYPAVPLFNQARQLAPTDGDVALGRIAALLAAGHGQTAVEQLAHLLRQSPGWAEGHIAYARLVAQVAPDQPIDASLRAALAIHPASGGLWRLVFQVWIEARNYRQTCTAVEEARSALGPQPELDRIEAICRTELGEPDAAQIVFDRLPFPTDPEMAIWPLRNYIRLGRYADAMRLAESEFAGHDAAPLWPYRALLWRLTGDPRWQWLEGDPRLIGCYDITPHIGPLDDLADVLRGLHTANGQPLDQSVRGGTQTDGNLLARAEPELRRLRNAVIEAARSYVAQLPPPDSSHPLLQPRRDELQVAGAWSVRLTDKGFHVDHVHCQGWISSACYVVVPPDDPLVPESGWLAFGESRDLLPEFRAFRTIEPKPGKLVLFPSIMWHGTRPFGSGERMTVAFDIARPGYQA